MLPVGLELTVSVLERTKTVHASDRAAAVIGFSLFYSIFKHPPTRITKCSSLHLLEHSVAVYILFILAAMTDVCFRTADLLKSSMFKSYVNNKQTFDGMCILSP
jgi:hypothetical protein